MIRFFIILFLVLLVVGLTSIARENISDLDAAIESSEKFQTILEQVKEASKGDFFVNHYEDDEGEKQVEVILVHFNIIHSDDNGVVWIVTKPGESSRDLSVKRLAVRIDLVVGQSDPDYNSFARQFLNQ